ncbi:MAG: tetratricopeptide repeat protein, partial [bacterium]
MRTPTLLLFSTLVCAAGLLFGQSSPAEAQSKAELQRESDAAYQAAQRLLRERKLPEAEREAQRSLELERVAGDRLSLAGRSTLLGTICMEMDRPAQARDYFVQALQLHEQRGNRGDMANALFNLGIFYLRWRQFEAADKATLAAIELYT